MTGWGGLLEGFKWSVLEKYIATAGVGGTLRAPVSGSTCAFGTWGKWLKREASEASGATRDKANWGKWVEWGDWPQTVNPPMPTLSTSIQTSPLGASKMKSNVTTGIMIGKGLGDIGTHWGNVRVILGVYWDNRK